MRQKKGPKKGLHVYVYGGEERVIKKHTARFFHITANQFWMLSFSCCLLPVAVVVGVHFTLYARPNELTAGSFEGLDGSMVVIKRSKRLDTVPLSPASLNIDDK